MKKIKINKAFVIQKSEKKTSFFNGETSQLITLNETASLIFNLLQKGIDTKQIIKEISTLYDIQEEIATEDIQNTIDHFKILKIIVEK